MVAASAQGRLPERSGMDQRDGIDGGGGLIDWDRVTELREEVGAEDFADIAVMFLEEVGEVIARLASAPEAGRMEADMHFLKGSAANLGFAAMAALCSAAEQAAAAGRPVDPGPVIACHADSRAAFLARCGGG